MARLQSVPRDHLPCWMDSASRDLTRQSRRSARLWGGARIGSNPSDTFPALQYL